MPTGAQKRMWTIEELNKNRQPHVNLTAIDFAESLFPAGRWEVRRLNCKCECGNFTITHLTSFVNSRTVSCGCHRIRVVQAKCTKYFPVNKKIYNSYCCMKHRCYNPKHASYQSYGGAGVVVCDEWKNDYQKFLDWSLANGWKEGLVLDKDINGNGMLYSPETCKWVTQKENTRASSRAIKISYKGKRVAIGEISDQTGVRYNLLYERVKRGMPIEEAINLGESDARKLRFIRPKRRKSA